MTYPQQPPESHEPGPTYPPYPPEVVAWNRDLDAPATPLPVKKNPPKWAVALTLVLMVSCVVGVVAVIVSSIGGDDAGQPTEEDLTGIETAQAVCKTVTSGIRVGDAGHSMIIDGAGLADGPSIEKVACVLAALDTPDSVASRIDNTRALDGTQTAEWDVYWASWTYHPDNGLNMVIEQR